MRVNDGEVHIEDQIAYFLHPSGYSEIGVDILGDPFRASIALMHGLGLSFGGFADDLGHDGMVATVFIEQGNQLIIEDFEAVLLIAAGTFEACVDQFKGKDGDVARDIFGLSR